MNIPLTALLAGTETQTFTDSPLPAISGLCYDSRKAKPGDLFFALKGAHADGASYVHEAVARGVVAVVAKEGIPGCAVPVVCAANVRAVMADIAAAFYGHPARTMKVVGITGTNGKTTTAFLTRHILDAEFRRTGLIGTVKYAVADRVTDAPRTTPESVDLQALLAQMRDSSCRAAVLEVSSHALTQSRSRGIEFDAAVFTNLTQDHLDYHGSMEAYFEAKASLFEGLSRQTEKKGRAIINGEDRHGRLLIRRLEKTPVPTLTYGLGAQADFRATDTQFDAQGSAFHLHARGRSYLVKFPLIGGFNVSNALAALAASASVGMEVRAAVRALADAPQVPGRLERIPARRSFQVFVDYAHTEDALRNALDTLRSLSPRRLLVVVGCGGDRDRTKRPLMAAAASHLADFCIFTSDNPRSEDPGQILADMTTGLRGTNFEVLPDRNAAIRHAVGLVEAGDILLIAGKGHENYQELATGRVPFDDAKIARFAIEERRVEFEEEEARP